MSDFKTINGYKVADGDLRNNVAPVFDQSIAYSVGDIVFHENQLYKCTTATAAGVAWNRAQWGETSVAELIKSIHPSIPEFFTKKFTSQEVNIPPQTTVHINIDGTIAGYKLLSIIGIQSASGYFFDIQQFITVTSEERISFSVYNDRNSSITSAFNAWGLYIKT